MARLAFKVEYDGRGFCGSQLQTGVRTVQGELERALAVFFRQPIRVHLSGRTDSGVHARGQVGHFDCPTSLLAETLAKFRSPVESQKGDLNSQDFWRLCHCINGISESDLSMASAQLVPDSFHSRYKATRRTYVYKILNRSQPSPFYLNSHYQVGTKLDLEAMNEALPGLLGNHDFSAFRSSSKDESSSICRVERAELLNLGEAELEFWISANHFVYNMVRIIVGTLIDIGLGKRSRSAIADALVGQRRALTGPTAPAWGLCLHAVEYPAEYGLFQELPV